MFLESVLNGLKSFSSWGVVGFLVMQALANGVGNRLLEVFGVRGRIFLASIAQVSVPLAAMAIAISAFLPAILGMESELPNYRGSALLVPVGLGVVAGFVGTMLLAAFAGPLRSLISPFVPAIAGMCALESLLKEVAVSAGTYRATPGLLESLGYLAVGAAVQFALMVPLSQLGVYPKGDDEYEHEEEPAPAIQILRGLHVALLNVLPLLMFGAHYGLALRLGTVPP